METCRLCAESSANQLSILPDMEFRLKIFQLFQIKVSIRDNLPTSVCQICYDMVGKIWEFNIRIQKAQDLLLDLINSGSTSTTVQSPEESTQLQTELDADILNTQNEVPLVPEFAYVDTKSTIKSEIDSSDASNELSDGSVSEKLEHKTLETKKTRKYSKRKTTKLFESATLKDSEFDLNEDGSIVPKSELLGWDTYPWTCCDCQVTFSLSDNLKEHYSSSHNCTSRYLCADCPKVYSKYTTFLAHVRLHRTKLRFCCEVCYRWFPTVASQEQHRSEHGGPHGCNTCGKRFKMQSDLMVHFRSHLPAELKKKYQCDQCPKKFITKPNLTAHKRIHAGVKDYTCDQCGKSFVEKGNFNNHLLTHTAARPFDCTVCGKSFKTSVRLRKHGSVHSDLKPHQCDVCGRQFREKSTLKEHHRIHTGDMPFTCEFCGKCFRFKGILTTHRRQHTGERPYSCDECQHHFTNWPNYNKHMKSRHGIDTSANSRTKQPKDITTSRDMNKGEEQEKNSVIQP